MNNCKAYTKWIAASLMLLFAFTSFGQQEGTIIKEGDVVQITASGHSPKKATLYSTMFPGLGQAYNKKYWKMPIVYLGLGASVYAIIWNQQQYKIYSDAFDLRQSGEQDQFFNIYTNQNLISLQNFYRNNRDLSVVIAIAVYGLQVLDANIDAHLFDFDVSEDLSIKAEPMVFNGLQSQRVFGARLTFNF